MKKLLFIFLIFTVLLFSSCTDEIAHVNENIVQPDFDKEQLDKMFGTDEIYIVNTYLPTPEDKVSEFIENNKLNFIKKHYQLSDGTWMTDEYSYKYKLEITGRMNNAAKDTTYVILSNNPDITFDMALKAFGYSSNSEDYFDEEDAVFVAVK